MSEPILILGRSGSGKSYSLRNLDPKETCIISVDHKKPPFSLKEWGIYSEKNTSGSIINLSRDSSYQKLMQIMGFQSMTNKKKVIVIDDSQYLMAHSFFKRANETGYQKFTDLGKNFWDLIDFSRNLHPETNVYFMHHIDKDDQGELKPKTLGKLLDDKACIEGRFTVCLYAVKTEDKYSFHSSYDSQSVFKAPPEMFPAKEFDNDLAVVDKCIRDYWGY